MQGDITLRKFRLMVEHLPPGNVLEVARNGWPESHWLAWQLDSRIRDLVGLTFNMNRGKDKPAMTVDYLPHPQTDEERERSAQQAAYEAQMQAEMDRLFDGR